jgi:CRP-like cAMP-binding protein
MTNIQTEINFPNTQISILRTTLGMHKRFSNLRKIISFTNYESNSISFEEKIIADHKTNKSKDTSSLEFIKASLASCIICSSLNADEIAELADATEHCEFSKGDIVCEQGKVGEHFFIVESGGFNVIVDERMVNHLGSTQTFGEIALLFNCTRSATVVAKSTSTLWVIKNDVFKKVIQKLSIRDCEENMNFIAKVEILRLLTPKQREILCSSMIRTFYKPDEYITKEDDSDTGRMFILKFGEVEVFVGNRSIRR